jgi:sorbitol-6-phosphate 2-dehydrogenase
MSRPTSEAGTGPRSGELEGKTALVTGGGQGLGQAICLRLAREGCTGVAVADINRAAAEECVAAIRDSGAPRCTALALGMDVTQERSVQAGFDQVVNAFGRLDLVVSNAGILVAGEVDTFVAEQWRKVVDVNLYGYFLTAKHAARVMKPPKTGVILQINSKSGKKGSYKSSAYSASKFGGIGLTQSLALELAEYGIRVNSICPGNLLDSPLWVNSLYAQYAKKWGITEEEVRKKYTEQVPLGRGCTYDDVTNVLVFLASDHASYMTGQAVNVTGGQEMR